MKRLMNRNLSMKLVYGLEAVFLAAVLLAAIICPAAETGATTCPAAGDAVIHVLVDGQEIDYGDTPPLVINERAYTGVRSLAQALGVPADRIKWDESTQTVSLSSDDTLVTLTLGSDIMQVNSRSVSMDVTPEVVGNRTYLPARYVAEALGFTVKWNENAQEALIQSSSALDSSIPQNTGEEPATTMSLASSSFADEGIIPFKYAAPIMGGENISPALSWTGAPPETDSLALLMYDIDAGNWLHWAVINIPAGVSELPEGASAEGMPEGCVQLINETDHTASYCGPGPPAGSGIHHYYIAVYALDTENLPPANGFESCDSLKRRIEAHALARGSYQGTCSR